MHRFRYLLFAASLFGFAVVGCDESQPNHSATPEEVTPDFSKKSGDMMRDANSGMDPKKLKSMAPGGVPKSPDKK